MTVENLFYIGHRYTDKNLIIKNSSILTLFEDIACMHSNAAGENYRESDSRWLLTSYKIKIYEKPMYGDEVNVITWARETGNITASREFEIRDKSGKLLICALSNWAYYNVVEKRFSKVSDEIIKAYDSQPDKTNFEEKKLKKLHEPNEYQFSVQKEIQHTWIDINNHLNNAHYLDLAQETVPEGIDLERNIDSIEIMYKQEICENNQVKCFFSETDTEYTLVYKNPDSSILHSIIVLHKKA